MVDFDTALIGVAELDAEALARPWTWRNVRLNVREALYRMLEDAQECSVRAAAGNHAESRRILALAQRAFGDLRGLLLGLPAALLDPPPGPGEWPLRETLRHMLWVERRYALQTRYAIERADGDPVRIPDDQLPALAQMDASGDVGAILGRLGDARMDTDRWLGDVPLEGMTRPTVWVQCPVDVRFRLHRFAAHLVEHTIQCEKTLAALGSQPTEGRRIARRISAAVGAVERLGAPADVEDLKARVAARFASLRDT
jgi:hypothetical protein